jgi:hypothetical protein
MNEENKTHGGIGNTNAVKAVKKESYIQMRVDTKIKSVMVRQAQYEGLKLSAWIQKTCLAAIDKELRDKFGVGW